MIWLDPAIWKTDHKEIWGETKTEDTRVVVQAKDDGGWEQGVSSEDKEEKKNMKHIL